MSQAETTGTTSRRNILKLGGAAALGAASIAALRPPLKASAAGSGNTLASWFGPYRVVDTTSGAKLAPGADMVVGPFPTPTQPFNSDSYYGMAGNLTATGWGPKGGWLSVRPNGSFFAGSQLPLLYFGGKVKASSNFFVERFGFPTDTSSGAVSDGRLVIHNGGPTAVHFMIDVYFFLGPDQ